MGKFGRSIPSNPDLWKCDETGVKENLWLNLSTGFFGSGRKVQLLSPLGQLSLLFTSRLELVVWEGSILRDYYS